MPKKERKKKETYVCVVCGKKQKAPKGATCCNKDMVRKEGVWPD